MMDFRYATSPTPGSPFAQAYHTRISRMEDGRPIDSREREYDGTAVDPLTKSPSASRRRSTIPIPDLSTLALGVPAVVIAGTANDPLVSSPPTRRRLPTISTKKLSMGTQYNGMEDGGKVVEMGSTMGSPIEPITLDCGEVVPGIDTKRPSIGVTRPSDEDKRRFVEGWAEEGRDSGRGEFGQMVSFFVFRGG